MYVMMNLTYGDTVASSEAIYFESARRIKKKRERDNYEYNTNESEAFVLTRM